MRRFGFIRLAVPDRSQIGDKCFPALLTCIWCYLPLNGYVAKLVGAIPVVKYFSDMVYPAVIVALILLSMEHLLKHIRPADVVFGVGAYTMVFLTAVFLPENAKYIEAQLGQVLLISVPVYYVGLTLDYEKNRKLLYWASVINVILSLIYRLNMLSRGDILLTNSMSASYKVLPSVMYLLLWSVRHGGLFNWIVAALGFFLTLLCGTRGPVVAIAVFVAAELIVKAVRMQSGPKRLLYTVVCVAAIFVFLIDGAWIGLAESISAAFEELGFSNRIFDYLLEGEFTLSNTRDLLAEQVIQGIWEKPFLGYGLMGDRIITDGHYVHNIFLEFICHYGLIFGTLLLMAVCVIPVVAIVNSGRTECFHFLLMLTCMVFVKLTLSSSYLLEPNFFLMLGVSVCSIRKGRA